jgi:hypothetical protein
MEFLKIPSVLRARPGGVPRRSSVPGRHSTSDDASRTSDETFHHRASLMLRRKVLHAWRREARQSSLPAPEFALGDESSQGTPGHGDRCLGDWCPLRRFGRLRRIARTVRSCALLPLFGLLSLHVLGFPSLMNFIEFRFVGQAHFNVLTLIAAAAAGFLVCAAHDATFASAVMRR